MIDLDAIRARDAEFSAEHMHTMTYGVQDRRALLAYVDELRSRLADLEAERALIIQRAENAEAALVETASDLDAACRGHDAAHAACVKYDERLAAANALLREGHEGGYFDASAGFYERIDAHLARKP